MEVVRNVTRCKLRSFLTTSVTCYRAQAGQRAFCALAVRRMLRPLGCAHGDEVHAEAQSNVMQYDGVYGDGVWKSTVKAAGETKARIKAFEAVGCDEVPMFMTAPALTQVDLLEEAVL